MATKLEKSMEDLVSVMTENTKLLKEMNNSQRKQDYNQKRPSSQKKGFFGSVDDPATSVASYGASLSRRFSAAIGGGIRVFAEQTDNMVTSFFESFNYEAELKEYNASVKKAKKQLRKQFKGFAVDAAGKISIKEEALDQLADLTPREFDRMMQSYKDLNTEVELSKTSEAARYRQGLNAANNLQRLAAASAGVTIALAAFRGQMLESARDLGGVNLGQAISNLGATTIDSISSLLSGDYVMGAEIRRVQSAYADEFGGLSSAYDSRRRVQFAQRAGIQATEAVALERALQSFGMGGEDVLNQFRDVNIGSRIATQEIVKNVDAVARSGDNFNTFIVQGVRNAKRLGLEFNKIEGTLTGFATDFTGTVSSFSQLRSILPSFGVNFNELLQTSLYGTTDEYINLIRTGLEQGGITDVSQLSRAQMSMLQQATGFGGAEMQRIFGDEVQPLVDLDQTRNDTLGKTLKTMLGLAANATALTGIASIGFSTLAGLQMQTLIAHGGGAGVGGMIRQAAIGLGMSGRMGRGLAYAGGVGGALGVGIGGVQAYKGNLGAGLISGILSGAVGGASLGALSMTPFGIALGALGGAGLGALTAFGGAGLSAAQNDFVFRPGQPVVPFSSSDTLVGMKDISKIGGSVDMTNLERKVDRLASAIESSAMNMKNGMELRIKDFDRALLLRSQSEMRHA